MKKIKNQILELFKNNINSYLSGEHISKCLGVSRASIWKYIKSLKEEGYDFESKTKIGYKLISCPDIMTYEEVKPYLATTYLGRNYYYYTTIDSTNIRAKALAKENAPSGTIIISEEQTLGRGRLGRQWFSSKGTGLWFSMILRPSLTTADISKLTLVGGAAVSLALSELGVNNKIKWPNDIFVNNKKLCGILTEISGELNMVNYVVMGIGVNVNSSIEDLNPEISSIATSLNIEFNHKFNRQKLLASILNNFEDLYENFQKSGSLESCLKICRDNSLIINEDILCISPRETFEAIALDINENGELVVKTKDNEIRNIMSGEVSIRHQ